MNEQQLMEKASAVSYELGAAVAVKQAADNAQVNGRPDVAEYLVGCLKPAHKLLLNCMKEAAAHTHVARQAA